MKTLFLAVFCAATTLSVTAAAADFTVDSSVDSLDVAPGDGDCADPLGRCSLRAAVMETNALAGADVITLPSGSYVLTIASDGTPDDGEDGDLDVIGDLTINGEGSDRTLLNVNGAITLDRGFHIMAPAASFTMTGLEIRNGNASLAPAGIKDAGGILIAGNIPSTLTDVSVNHCTADNVGGVGGMGPLTLVDSFVEDNTTGGSVGGVGVLGTSPLILTNTVVDGNTAGSTAGGLLASDELTVTGGSVSRNQGALGGAIFNPSSKPVSLTGVAIEDNEASTGGGLAVMGPTTLEDCRIDGNRAVADGGGIASGPAATLTLTGGSVSDNTAGGNGGGILTVANISLTGTTVQGNTAGGAAGGIGNSGASATNTLNGVTVKGNSASQGGGVIVTGNLSMGDSVVAENTAFGTFGGGIAASGAAGTVDILRTTIRDNTSINNGGGLYVTGGTALTLADSTVSGNADLGPTGGGGLVFGGGSSATLTNITISGNSAASNGGGVYGDGPLTMTNTTFFGNEATTGGNLFLSGADSHTIKNSILAGAVSGGNCAGALPTSSGFNIDDANTCGFAGTGDQHDTDPMLAPLADNGGPTLTHALLTGSPAIDRGTEAGAPNTDQRGVPRPIDGDGDGTAAFDVGAVELNACGDGVAAGDEECDDGNSDNDDACTNVCRNAACGDGFIQSGSEECDDANPADGDGCSQTCGEEEGFTCSGSPSVCTPAGDGTGGEDGGGCSLIQ